MNEGSLKKTSAINIFLSGLNALLTLLALVLVAKNFGGSTESDSYFFLLSISTLFTNLITCTLGTVFLPTFIELKIKYGMKTAEYFASQLLIIFLLVILLISAASLFFYQDFYLIFSRFNLDQILASKNILHAFSAVFIFSVLAEFFKVLAQAAGRFIMAAISALFQPIALILFILFGLTNFNEEVLPISLVASRLAMFIFMFYITVISSGIRLSFFSDKKIGLTQFFSVASPYWSANLITSFALFFFDYLASGLGVGVITAVSYAQKIFVLPTQLIIAPLMEIARAEFSKFRALNDNVKFHSLYFDLMTAALLMSVPISMFIFFNSEAIISSLFERGLFTADLTDISSNCLKFFALAIPFNCMFNVNGRAAESFQRLGWLSLIGAIGNISLIVFSYALVSKLGYIGIPTARFMIEIIYFLPFGFIAIYMLSGALPIRSFLKSFGVSIFLSLTAIQCTNLFSNLLIENKFINLIMLTVVFLVIYITLISLIYLTKIYQFPLFKNK